MRGAEPLVFGHAELFLKARALIDHGWIGRLAETEEGGEAAAAPLFHPKKVRKNGWNGTKNPYKNLFYKVWHVWRSSNLLELPLIFVTLSQKKNLMLERAFLSAFLVVKNTRLQLPLFE